MQNKTYLKMFNERMVYLKMPSIDDSWTQFSIFQAGEIAARVPLIKKNIMMYTINVKPHAKNMKNKRYLCQEQCCLSACSAMLTYLHSKQLYLCICIV